MFYFLIFLFGLAVGSFSNCVIYRLETGGNLKGRSFCPRCRHQLAWHDLVPVLSFLWLGGRCRYCRQKISWQYPIVEIATGLIFLLILKFQFSIFNEFSISNFQTILDFIYLLVAASLLIIIFIFDLKHYIIPDKVLFPAIIITIVYHVLRFVIWDLGFVWDLSVSWRTGVWNFIVSALGASLFFLIIFLVSRGRWMGFGDVKLAFFMGLFLGFPDILVALFFAFLIGAIIGLGLAFAGRKTLKSEVPFGPFLITGTFIALFWGQEIAGWYLGMIVGY